jgi:hypothetical protein
MTCIQQVEMTDELALEVAAELKPKATLDRLADAGHRLRSRPDVLRSHLRFLASSPDRLAEVSRSAYWHVNGFAKIKLVERDDFCVRLHVWPAGKDRTGDRDPHSHRWDFASWIVVGPGLSEMHFTVTDSSDTGGLRHVEYDYGRCRAGDRHGKPRLKPGGGVAWLRAKAPLVRDYDSVYACSHTVIHTVAPAPGGDLVATIVLQGPPLADSNAVYRSYGHRHFPALERPIDLTDLGVLIRAVEAAITIRQ